MLLSFSSFFTWHSRTLWLIFSLAGVGAAIMALKLMFVIAPGLSVEIDFSREQAVAAARSFQQKQFPDLKTDRAAAVFISDRNFQNYVELEGGGVKVFQQLIPQLDAVTHYWKVRTFTAGQEEELITAFSPRGEPISFSYLIAEKTPGAALEEMAARKLAEAGAREFMGERFSAYKQFETQQKRQASGRVDYSFTYEHASLAANEARFRLSLKVAGDKLVAVDTFKHIPQAFDQRFGEMRSLNTQISQIASYLLAILFGLGGLLGGGVWLFRRHQLRWFNAFWPALVLGAGLAASVLVSLPAAWMGYNTTSSAQTFIFQHIAQAGGVLVAASLIFATIYAVAEGLTRVAFVNHPRLWDMWRPAAAASPEVSGRVIGGFVWTGFFLLYAVVFYWFSTRVLGWWQPADIHSDPNILASWRPALAPIFTALQAGTWEECLFRAIPLSLAVLIGTHYGIRNKLVIATLILQALIFAGAHANYPNLPGYSRLIELFIPAMVFGVVYLRFGLMVCMLAHFEYDLVLMSLPIFIAEDSSLWIDRALVISAGCAPLFAVIWARWRRGALTALGDEFRNSSVMPVLPSPEPVETAQEQQALLPAIRLNRVTLMLIGLVSIALMIAAAVKPPRIDWEPYRFQIDRHQAQHNADRVLREQGVELKGEWRRTTTTHTSWSQPLEYVWRESGASKVQELIGKYLDTPFWVITWRKFDGPVEERSEYWQVWLYPDGRLHELVHSLPEGRAGAKLTREQAVAKAQAWITAKQWSDLNQLEEKSVEEILRPARNDWVVTYLDKNAYHHNNASAAIVIKIAGDEITSYVRTVDIPEEWKRAESEEHSRQQPYKIVGMVAMLLLFGSAALSFFRKQMAPKFSVRAAWPWIGIVVTGQLLVFLLWIDPALAGLQTTMGWWAQVAMLFVGFSISISVMGVFTFFAAQAIHGNRPRVDATFQNDLLLGAVLALGLGGYRCLLELVLPSVWAPAPYSGDWATAWPLATTILNGLKGMFPMIIVMMLALGLARSINKTWKLLLIGSLALVWLCCSSLASREFPVLLGQQLLTAATVGITFLLIRRQQWGVVIALFGFQLALRQVGVMHAIYPGAEWHGALSFIVCSALTYGLLRHWYRHGLE